MDNPPKNKTKNKKRLRKQSRQSNGIVLPVKIDHEKCGVYAAKQVTLNHLRQYMNCQNSTNLLDILVLIDTDQ